MTTLLLILRLAVARALLALVKALSVDPDPEADRDTQPSPEPEAAPEPRIWSVRELAECDTMAAVAAVLEQLRANGLPLAIAQRAYAYEASRRLRDGVETNSPGGVG